MHRSLPRLAAAAALAVAARQGSAAGDVLSSEQWKTRPLVVFAASADDPDLATLRRELVQPSIKAQFDERDMVLYSVVGNVARRGDRALPPAEAAALRRALSTDPAVPLQAVLVGKDGGVKVRQRGRVDLEALFVTIDGMPMRAR